MFTAGNAVAATTKNGQRSVWLSLSLVVSVLLIVTLCTAIVFVWSLSAESPPPPTRQPPSSSHPSSPSYEPLLGSPCSGTSPAPAAAAAADTMDNLSCAVPGSAGILPVKLSLQVFSMGMCTCLFVMQLVKFYQSRKRIILPQNEDSRMIAQQRIFNEKRCIRCCSNFSVLFNKRRLCEKCKFHICKECSVWDADTQTWLCKFCSSREPSPSPEWLQKKLLERCRNFESAKKIKGNQRTYDEYRDNENDSGYDPSISVASWDSSFPKHKSLPDLLEGNPMLDPDILEIHEHVEAIVENLIGDTIENTTLDPLYHNPEYDRMFEIYHGQLQESLLHLIQSLQLSINNQPIDENRTPTSAHSSLKYIIEKVVEEAMALPYLYEPETTSTPLPSISPTGNTEEDYDDQSYEDILATAVLNKIIEKYQKGKQLNKQFRNETFIYLNNNVNGTAKTRCESICSYVSDKEIQTDFETDAEISSIQKRSVRPKQQLQTKYVRGESSDVTDDADEDFSWALGANERPEPIQYTIEEQIEEITTTVEEPNSTYMNGRTNLTSTPRRHGDEAISEPLIVQTKLGREASLPDLTYLGVGLDFAAERKVPFPEFGVDLHEGATDDQLDGGQRHHEDDDGAEEASVMDTWENNWLFRQTKFVSPFRNLGSMVIGDEPISMLVPNPQEDVKATIGNRDIDELSDMSEKNSRDFTASEDDDETNSLNEEPEDQEDLPQDTANDVIMADILEPISLGAEEDRSLSNSHYESLSHLEPLDNDYTNDNDVAELDYRYDQIDAVSIISPVADLIVSGANHNEEIVSVVEEEISREPIIEINGENHAEIDEVDFRVTDENETAMSVKLSMPTPAPRKSKTPPPPENAGELETPCVRPTPNYVPLEQRVNKGQNLSFVSEPKSESVLIGQNVRVECRVASTAQYEFRWFHDQKPIENDEQIFRQSRSGDKHTLEIENIQTCNSGSYSCVVHDNREEIWSDFHIVVTVPPIIVSEELKEGLESTKSQNSKSHYEDGDDELEASIFNSSKIIPGTIAEREKQKWLQAISLPNNPYSSESIAKRTQRSSSFTVGVLSGARYAAGTVDASADDDDATTLTESPLKRSESDRERYRRDYYVSQDKNREPYFKRKPSYIASTSIEETRDDMEQTNGGVESAIKSKINRFDSQSQVQSSERSTENSKINSLEENKVVRALAKFKQHENEASKVEHKLKHLRQEPMIPRVKPATSQPDDEQSSKTDETSNGIVNSKSYGETILEFATRSFDGSPTALIGLPSVKRLASQFNNVSNAPNTSSGSLEPKNDVTVRNGAPNVHSLTARSLSREFREASSIVKPHQQPPRANVVTTTCGPNASIFAAPAARQLPADGTATLPPLPPPGVDTREYASDEESNASSATSGKSQHSRTRRTMSRSIKSRAAFWDRRVAEELLADNLVDLENFPPMESYAEANN